MTTIIDAGWAPDWLKDRARNLRVRLGEAHPTALWDTFNLAMSAGKDMQTGLLIDALNRSRGEVDG